MSIEMELRNEIGRLCSLVSTFIVHQAKDHPNIVKVHESFRDDKYYYVVME